MVKYCIGESIWRVGVSQMSWRLMWFWILYSLRLLCVIGSFSLVWPGSLGRPLRFLIIHRMNDAIPRYIWVTGREILSNFGIHFPSQQIFLPINICSVKLHILTVSEFCFRVGRYYWKNSLAKLSNPHIMPTVYGPLPWLFGKWFTLECLNAKPSKSKVLQKLPSGW